jgi:hypothetical protein
MSDLPFDSTNDRATDAATDAAHQIARTVTGRKMATPALVFLLSHRPLAFAAGQLLYAVHPLAALLNVMDCAIVASVLSAPDGHSRIESALAKTEPQTEPNPRPGGI